MSKERNRGGVSTVGKVHEIIGVSVTRPADTTQYAAGEVLTDGTAAALEFTGCGRTLRGSGEIVRATLIDSAAQATKGDFELWLFSVEPAAFGADNAVFTPTDAELASIVGIIAFAGSAAFVGDATAGAGGNCVYQAAGVNLPFECADADQALYGVLVVRSTYTPVSAEIFTVLLHVRQD